MERSNQSREGGRGEGAGKQSKINVVVVAGGRHCQFPMKYFFVFDAFPNVCNKILSIYVSFVRVWDLSSLI